MSLKCAHHSQAVFVIVTILCTITNSLPNHPKPVVVRRQFNGYPHTGRRLLAPIRASNVSANKTETCLAPSCIKAAESILNRMDLTANPCDDFYQFACGNYEKINVIPDEKTSLNIFEELNDDLSKKLKKLLEEPASKQETKIFKQVKELYMICKNTEKIEQRQDYPLLDVLKKIGGFPVLEPMWDERKFYWPETLKALREEGLYVDVIVDLSVGIDVTDSTRRRIDLDQPVFGIDQEFLKNGREDSNVEAYFTFKRDLAVLLGAPPIQALKDMSDVVDFEIELATIASTKEDRLDFNKTNNPIAIIDLQNRYPWLYWLDHINSMMPPDVPVGEYEIVNLFDLKYYDSLGPLLARTPSRTISNYIMGRVAFSSVKFLTDRLRKRRQEYLKTVYGQSKEEPRWKECVDYLQEKLPIALSAMYVRRYFKKDSKNLAKEMVDDVKQMVKEDIQVLDWMDVKTKKTALKKLDKMITLIGYPNELNSDAVLAKYYKDLEIVSDNYFETDRKIQQFTTNVAYRKLREDVKKDDWRDWATAAVVNAYYHRASNYIFFPAGILQGQFFASDRPNYLNYGAIGSVIGHEITHGFDDVGSQFDENGNLNNWWEPPTSDSFKSKSQCMVDQYGSITDKQTNLKLNGIITLGENIADNGGVQFSYLAYKKYVQRHRGPEHRLPKFENFSPEQMFWLGWAQSWCSLYKTESKKVQITSDRHPPGPYRAVFPLKNNNYFAGDFKCSVDSPMNPSKKCKVW